MKKLLLSLLLFSTTAVAGPYNPVIWGPGNLATVLPSGGLSSSLIVATTGIVDTTPVVNVSDNTKALQFSLGGMTTGKKLTVVGNQTNSASLQIPNIAAGGDTLATLGIANTFTADQTISVSSGTALDVASSSSGTTMRIDNSNSQAQRFLQFRDTQGTPGTPNWQFDANSLHSGFSLTASTTNGGNTYSNSILIFTGLGSSAGSSAMEVSGTAQFDYGLTVGTLSSAAGLVKISGGSTSAVSAVNIYNNNSNSNGYLQMGVEPSAGGSILTGTTGYAGAIGTQTATPLFFGVNGAEQMVLAANGFVGMGITNPLQPLEIAAASASGVSIRYAANSSSRNWGFVHDVNVYGDFAINTSSSKTAGLLDLTRMYFDASGDVAIGNGNVNPHTGFDYQSAGNTFMTISSTSASSSEEAIEFWNTNASNATANWEVGININNNNYWEIIPTNAIHGSTFSGTSVFRVGSGGTVFMPSTGSVTPGTAACFSASGQLGTDASNCIASLGKWKQDLQKINGQEALDTVSALAQGAVYYRYTDEFLGAAKDNPHARDMQPGFIAEQVERVDPRYASYNGADLRGVKYEQLTATEAVAIAELTRRIKRLETELKEEEQ